MKDDIILLKLLLTELEGRKFKTGLCLLIIRMEQESFNNSI